MSNWGLARYRSYTSWARARASGKAPAFRRALELDQQTLTNDADVDKDDDGDTYVGSFPVDQLGRYEWTIEAWIDRFASWREEIRRKVEFGQRELAGELSEEMWE